MPELGAPQVGGTGPHNLGTSTFFLGGLLSKGSVVLTSQFALRRLADGLAEPSRPLTLVASRHQAMFAAR
jgi:hypothetical protein